MGRVFIIYAALAAFLGTAGPAEARRGPADLSREFTGDRYSGYAPAQAPQIYTVKKARKAYRKATAATAKVARTATRIMAGTLGGYAQHITKDLSGFPEPLVVKVREIERECRSKVVSAFRPGARVRYTGSLSNHARRKAVDMAGNPACMYAHLKGFPGGVSTDYDTAPGGKHVHISYNPGGPEWGRRFAHGGHKTRLARLAKKRIRYARLQ